MSVAETYRFNLPELESAQQQHQTALTHIQHAHEKALQTLQEIQGSNDWTGLQKEEFESFLTLVVAVHGDLIGYGDYDPYPRLVNGLKDLTKSLDTYTSHSPSYRELNNL